MKTVNFEEIFEKQNPQDGKLPEWARIFAKEACRQTLELAAENANVSVFDYIDKDFKEFRQNKNVYAINDGTYVQIDKQSILDTINQIQ